MKSLPFVWSESDFAVLEPVPHLFTSCASKLWTAAVSVVNIRMVILCVCNAQADWHWSLYLMKLLTYIFYLYISLLFRICLGPTCACRFFYLLMNQQGVLLLDNFTVDLLGWLGQKLKATFVAFTCAVTVIAALPRKWSLELVRTQEPSISISYLPHETGSSPVFPGVNLSFMLWLEVRRLS